MRTKLITLSGFILTCLVGCASGEQGSFWARTFGNNETQNTAPLMTDPKRESWCYKSLGEIDCYPVPQNLPAESLFSVDPPSRFPTTRDAYGKALADSLRPKSAE